MVIAFVGEPCLNARASTGFQAPEVDIMRKMASHHAVWLSVHPHRSYRWFRARIREGFDIHHIDGDHENDDPGNLVLLEHTDHMALHNGGHYTLGRLKWVGGAGRPKKVVAEVKERSIRKKQAGAVYEKSKLLSIRLAEEEALREAARILWRLCISRHQSRRRALGSNLA